MELLGKNLYNYAKAGLNEYHVYDILFQVLNLIEEIHNKGIIHLDIKPNNFVMDRENKKVFIIDFGLSRGYLDANGNLLQPKENCEFRGTLTYASINAHNKIVILI
jgi:serine/threonine protein kinase